MTDNPFNFIERIRPLADDEDFLASIGSLKPEIKRHIANLLRTETFDLDEDEVEEINKAIDFLKDLIK